MMNKMFGGGSGGGNSAKGGDTVVDTLIGRQTEILGDVRFSGGLHVDGKIKGKIVADSGKGASLSISENGAVEGDVRVPNIVLNGRVTGDVHASEHIHLAAKARVNGNVYYKIIEMEGGAEINGQLVRDIGDANSSQAAQVKAGSAQTATIDQLSEIRKLKGV